MAMESRAGARVRIDATIMVEIDMGMKDDIRILREPQKAEIIDISIVGLGVVAPIYFPKSAVLIIDMDASVFSMDESARIMGEVRYCRPAKDGKYRLGIKFIEIDKAFLSRIKEYVDKNKDKPV